MQLPRPGDRIRLVAMPNDPDPIPPDSMGTVQSVTEHGADHERWFQVEVEWDTGRNVMLSIPPDQVEIVGRGSTEFRPGDHVIIRSNPHDAGSEQIIGTVVSLKPGAGFAGCTLAEVEYRNPQTNESRIDSFGLACFDLATGAI